MTVRLAIFLCLLAVDASAQDLSKADPNTAACIQMLQAAVMREGNATANAIAEGRQIAALKEELATKNKEIAGAKKPKATEPGSP